MSSDNEIVIYTFGTNVGKAAFDTSGMTAVDLCELLPDLVDASPSWPHPDDAQETELQLRCDPRLETLSRDLVEKVTRKMSRDALTKRCGLIKPVDFAVFCRDGRRLSPYLAEHLARDLWLHGGGFDAKVVNLQLKADRGAIRALATQLDQAGPSVFEVCITDAAVQADHDHRLVRGLEELAALLNQTADAGRTADWRLANHPMWVTAGAGTQAMSVECPHCSYRPTHSFDGSLASAAAALLDLTVRAEHRHLGAASLRL